MKSNKIYYKEGYKYQLANDYSFETGIILECGTYIEGYVYLSKTGALTIKAGYAWDGASGPTIDTKSSMRGSLLHDALYQLMREGKLSSCFKNKADEILRDECMKDGMYAWRAHLWYFFVQHFAGFAITKQTPVLSAP